MNDGSIGSAGSRSPPWASRTSRRRPPRTSLAGRAPRDVFADAGRLAAEAASPVADVRGSADVQAAHGRGLRAAWPGPRRSRWPARPEPRRRRHMEIKMNVNGTAQAADVEPRQLLVHVIREELAPHRHARRLRHHQLRRLHGAPGRHAGEVMHDVRRPGRRASRSPRSRDCAGGRAPSDPGRVQRTPRPAMRLLHTGDDARRRGPHRARTRPRATTTSGGRSRGTSAGAPAT